MAAYLKNYLTHKNKQLPQRVNLLPLNTAVHTTAERRVGGVTWKHFNKAVRLNRAWGLIYGYCSQYHI